MTDETGEPETGAATPDNAVPDAARHTQIEHRLQNIFHLAGDGDPARQLLRMIIAYRLGQQQ